MNMNPSYAERQRAAGRFPIVLRLEAVEPNQISGIIGHAQRRIGDLSHVDPRRRELNETLIGSDDIARQIAEECAEMRAFNHRSHILGLRAMHRKKEARAALERGPQDPWISSGGSAGPLREGILSVHRDHFVAAADCPPDFVLEFLADDGEMTRHDLRKHAEFKSAGQAFLETEYGASCVYARYDLDEQSGHLHFLIVDRIFEPPAAKTPRYAHGRYLYRTSHHRTIGGIPGDPRRGYEIAQDVAAEWFERAEYRHLNIVRGEDRAKQHREADKEIRVMLEQQREADFFTSRGRRERMPEGSEKAQIAWLLKKRARENASRSGRLRLDDRQKLALDLLELEGALDPRVRHQHQTRRAREELLARYLESHGSTDEILASFERIISESAVRAVAEIEAAKDERDRLDRAAEERRQAADRAAEDRRRRAAEEEKERIKDMRQREARRLREARTRRNQIVETFAERQEQYRRMRAELERDKAQIRRAFGQIRGLADLISAAAKAVGVADTIPVVQLKTAIQKILDLAAERQEQRER